MKHTPPDYDCPFCRLVKKLAGPGAESDAVVLEEGRAFAFVPLHFRGKSRGNCLIVPKAHYENVFDVPESLGNDFLGMTKRLAVAMKRALACEGISTRQHNEPAGDQDVWHFHLHVTPRFHGDQLYTGPIVTYDEDERLAAAHLLRKALRDNSA